LTATAIAHKHNTAADKEPANVPQIESAIAQQAWSSIDTNTEKEQEA